MTAGRRTRVNFELPRQLLDDFNDAREDANYETFSAAIREAMRRFIRESKKEAKTN